MSRASNDVSTVRTLTGFGAVMVVQTTLAFVGTLISMALIDPWLTLYSLAPYPALIGLSRRFSQTVEDAVGRGAGPARRAVGQASRRT